jgi:hypothetical protein
MKKPDFFWDATALEALIVKALKARELADYESLTLPGRLMAQSAGRRARARPGGPR